MASSQIEIASSSAPFGYGLRDHNLRDRWSNRDSNAAAAYQNLKDFVDSISGQPNKKSAPAVDSGSNGMSQNNVHNKNNNKNDNQIEPSDLWVHIPTYKTDGKNNDIPQSNKCDDRLSKKREIDFSNDCMTQNHRGVSAPASPVQRKADIPTNMGGVSSLLRRWRDFEAESKNSANSSPMSVSRTTSADANNNNHNNNTISEAGDNESSVDIRSETRSMNEDIFGEWESDRTVYSGRESDATEKERTRVVDIIRKLTTPAGITDDNGNENESSPPRSRVSLDSEQQKSSFSPYVGSPRLRGRQAFGDLLMQLQKDRHKELEGLVETNAVSKFSQKARIQAMLRVQFMRRGAMEVKDARTSNGTSLEVNRLRQSAIKHLRDRFDPISEDSVPGRKSPENVVADVSQVEKSPSVQGIKGTHKPEVEAGPPSLQKKESENTKAKKSLLKSEKVNGSSASNDKNKEAEEKNTLPPDSSGNVPKEACSKSNFLQESANEENKRGSILPSVETSFSSTAVKEVHSTEGYKKTQQGNEICQESMSYNVELQENLQNIEIIHHNRTESVDIQTDWEDKISSNQHNIETIHLKRTESVNTQQDWEEEILSNQYLSESEHGWVSDVSHTQVEWEELHSDYERQVDCWQDWIGDISRPRSEWEGLRQERYQEMLDPFGQKEDICRLLESKSVSSFLSSPLRENIDRLMVSRTQQQQFSDMGNQKYEQVSEVEESEYKVNREHQEDENVIEEAEGGDPGYDQDDEGNDEDENQVEQQCEEAVEYADQSSSSLPLSSWNRDHVLETSDFSDHVEFSCLQQNSPANSYFQESSRPSSSVTNRCSIEMQLIYELRGHMEQLHEEMSEIRNSIKSCMKMQLELQRSVKDDVVAALSRSGQNRGRQSTPKKGLINKSMCCICYDEQVDSLLYRCGHMCTCFKCANELQWGSGRCPVCQAPIIDVVRTHANSSMVNAFLF